MIQAIKLIIKEGTTFDLYFYDGCVKRYDALMLADKFSNLNQLRDRKLFEKGKLFGWSGVVWNDEIDIGAETVYEEGTDVTSEYDDIELVTFGYSVKEARLKLFLTQEEAAAKIGIDQADLSKIETGKGNTTILTMKKIADAFNLKLQIKFK